MLLNIDPPSIAKVNERPRLKNGGFCGRLNGRWRYNYQWIIGEAPSNGLLWNINWHAYTRQSMRLHKPENAYTLPNV